MAEIYRAKTFDAHGHAHLVAVKRVLAHLAEDDDFIQMLVDEAKIASVLRHANIARVYEFARAGGEYFIAMEHVDGKDMRTLLERCRHKKKAMPPEHAAYVAAEVASALHAAHSAVDAKRRPLRIVHRDVSPSNVIASYVGEVKLCDFGIAKATLSKVNTKTGVIKGKVKYMSPEQALGRKLDHRSDVFSLGSCLYEMLTRVPPFTASNEMDLLIKVRDAKYRAISDLAPGVPPELEQITDKCLTRSRAHRYQTAAELEVDLRAFLRRYVPNYSRSHLGRYMRKMFAERDRARAAHARGVRPGRPGVRRRRREPDRRRRGGPARRRAVPAQADPDRDRAGAGVRLRRHQPDHAAQGRAPGPRRLRRPRRRDRDPRIPGGGRPRGRRPPTSPGWRAARGGAARRRPPRRRPRPSGPGPGRGRSTTSTRPCTTPRR